jgi:alanyl-tRNA synthetase
LLFEVITFKKTISKWLKILSEKLDKIENNWKLQWSDIFFLYDTCGFPLELTREICLEKNIQVDEEWFQKELETQKERSRKSAKFQKDIDRSKYLVWIPQTEFIGYTLDGWAKENKTSKLLKDFDAHGQRVLIFDKTPFYAESGWQKGDSGKVELDWWEIVKIRDVQKYEWVFLHLVK